MTLFIPSHLLLYVTGENAENRTKNALQIMSLASYASETNEQNFKTDCKTRIEDRGSRIEVGGWRIENRGSGI